MLQDIRFHLHGIISETDQAPVWQVLTGNRKKKVHRGNSDETSTRAKVYLLHAFLSNVSFLGFHAKP